MYWKKYILEKKEKANLVIPIVKKKSKDAQLVDQKKKKTTVRAAKMQNVLNTKLSKIVTIIT